MDTDRHAGWICPDCLILWELGPEPLQRDVDAGRMTASDLAAVLAVADNGWQVTPGTPHPNDTCQHGPQLACPRDVATFSMEPCDACGRVDQTYERFPAVLWRPVEDPERNPT